MSRPIAGDRIVDPTDQATINRILQTIRNMESHSNYTAINRGDGKTTNVATGAYQYLNSTWRGLVGNISVASGYPSAYQAPPSVQDFVAEINVRRILASHGNHLAAVPIGWYQPAAWDNDAKLDAIPAPSQGNSITVRAYAESWIRSYDKTTTGGANASTSQTVPSGTGLNFPGSGVLTNVGQALGLDKVGQFVYDVANAANPLDAIKAFLGLLTSGELWIRIAQVIGGFVMIGMGVWTLTHDQPIGAVGDTMTGAAGLAAIA